MSDSSAQPQNKNVVLVMGPPNSGKTTALRNLNQKDWAYFNTDLKETPFRNTFAAAPMIDNAQDILNYIPEVEQMSGIRGAVLDTLTFLMSMYERQYVAPKAGTKAGQAAWGDYGNFYRSFIHAIKAGTKDYAILAHEETKLNEQAMMMESSVPVKGQVGKTGVEADFTVILASKQMPIKMLEGVQNDLLKITDEEKEDGVKYVFVTRITDKFAGSKMRSPMGLWKRNELYIDNDLNLVFNRLKDYYK